MPSCKICTGDLEKGEKEICSSCRAVLPDSFDLNPEPAPSLQELPPQSFSSFEEMQKWLSKQTGMINEVMAGGEKLKKAKAKKKPAGSPSKKTKVKFVDPAPKEAGNDLIYQVVHYYTRPNDTFGAVRIAAKEELGYRGSSVKIMIHDHTFTQQCTGGCYVL